MQVLDSLRDRRVLITGGSTGIGAAAAYRFASAGCQVTIGYHRSKEAAEEIVNRITANGGRAFALQGDVSKYDEATAVVNDAVRLMGGLDVLVNNAGSLIMRRPIEELDVEVWHQIMDVNLSSTFYCTRAAIPFLKESTQPRIINIGSIAGQMGGANGAIAYATAKGAIHTFTRGLAREIASSGITVNCVAPGVIDTPFHKKFTSEDRFKALMDEIPVRRAGESEEVADAILFLASSGASYITGQVIPVNGGQLTV